MELSSFARDIINILTPQWSGRPRFVSAAIRRSAVVAAMGLRAMRISSFAPMAAFMASAAIFAALSREWMENHGISQAQLGRGGWIAMQVACAIYLLAILKGSRTTMALKRLLAL